MTLYGWVGPGQTRALSLARSTPPTLTAPTDTGSTDTEKHFRCTVPECGRKFRKAAIMARHFNTKHSDLKTDAETWRSFTEEIWE